MGNCFALCINSCTSTVSTTQSKNITGFTMPILAKDVEEEEAQFSGGALTHKACNLSSPIQNVAVISSDSDTEQTGTTMKRIKVIITKQQLQNLLSNQERVEDFLSFSAGGGSHPEAGSSSTKPRLHSIPEETELLCSIL